MSPGSSRAVLRPCREFFSKPFTGCGVNYDQCRRGCPFSRDAVHLASAGPISNEAPIPARLGFGTKTVERANVNRWRIAIVGGGPGGLMTAYQLQKYARQPFELTMYEASSRLGGKILTPQFESTGIRFEAGAAEFYDYTPISDDPLKEMIAELGLSIRPMGGAAVIVDNHIVANRDDVRTYFGDLAYQSYLEFDRQARDVMSPGEFYQADQIAVSQQVTRTGEACAGARHRFDSVLQRITDPQIQRFIQVMIHSDLATEPDQTSIDYGLQNYVMNHPAYMHLYSIDGGNEQLTQELSRRIQARVLLKHPVTQITSLNSQQFCIRTQNGSEEEFDWVIVALPNNAIRHVAFQNEELSFVMDRHRQRFDHPAHYLRITLLFDRPFWRRHMRESYLMLDAFGGCCLYDESSRLPDVKQGVIGFLLGGESARELAHLTDEELVGRAMAAFPPILSPAGSQLLGAKVFRWTGAVNALPGGEQPVPLEARHRPSPDRFPNLFIVGDYLFDSTLNGVLDSADFVSQWLAELLTDRPTAPNLSVRDDTSHNIHVNTTRPVVAVGHELPRMGNRLP